jgi:antitoxin component YwqK of YwqJK toxin-antitoxin module
MNPPLYRRLFLPWLLASLLGLTACKKRNEVQTVDYDQLGWKKNVYYLNEKPYEGIAIQFHSSGAVKGQWEFKNGVPHGKVTEFDTAGTRIAETHYRNGLRHGRNTYWDSEGTPIKFQVFEKGKLLSEETAGALKQAAQP